LINLLDCVEKYKSNGLDEIYANAKVCQDVILTHIFKSNYRNHITVKGGLVMFNLTNDLRRATVDIDFDLIRISIADNEIYKIFEKSNLKGININVDIAGIKELSHQDYKGKRIPLSITDTFGNRLSIIIDVGVHTEYNILQDELCFDTGIEKESLNLLVNSKEQIFVEKIIPLVRFGAVSTRYKDLFDIYWLIKNTDMDKEKINVILREKVFFFGINDIYNINNLITLFEKTLSKSDFIKKLMNRKNNWLDINDKELKNTITNYLESLIGVEI